MNENIGILLRKAREEQGYSLEEVAQETKIQKRYILDLEDENYDDMPGRIYEKGFLKTYATLLNLDVDMLMEFYDKSRGEYFKEESVKLEDKGKDNTKKSKLLLFLGIIIAAVLIYIIYSFVTPSSEKVKRVDFQKQEVLDTDTEENTSSVLEVVLEDEKNNIEKVKEVSDLKEEIKTEVAEESKLKEKAVKPYIEDEKKQLILDINGKSWVEVYVNDKRKFYNIANNRKIKVEADKDQFIKIKVGDSSKVVAIYNGENLGILGKENQVVRKTF